MTYHAGVRCRLGSCLSVIGENPDLQDGRVVTDYSHRNRTGNERIVITPESDPPLRAGTYFVAIAVYTTGVRRQLHAHGGSGT